MSTKKLSTKEKQDVVAILRRHARAVVALVAESKTVAEAHLKLVNAYDLTDAQARYVLELPVIDLLEYVDKDW